MDDDLFTCQICLEAFNNKDKLPKHLTCCNQRFCLQCLVKIFNKNLGVIACPMCRKNSNKNPNELNTVNYPLQAKTICPSCLQRVEEKNLKLTFKTKSKPGSGILCVNCAPQKDIPLLDDFITNLKDEMLFYINSFSNINYDIIPYTIEIKVSKFIDDLFDKLKVDLKRKVKNKIELVLKEIFPFDKEKFYCEFTKLRSHYDKINSMNEKNIATLLNAVDYYILNMEQIKHDGSMIRKGYNFLLDKSELYLTEKAEDLQDIITSMIEINSNHKTGGHQKFFKSFTELKKENDLLAHIIETQVEEIRKLNLVIKSLNINKTKLVMSYIMQNFHFTIDRDKHAMTNRLREDLFSFALTDK